MPRDTSLPREPSAIGRMKAIKGVPHEYQNAFIMMVVGAEMIGRHLETQVALHAIDAQPLPSSVTNLARSVRLALENFDREAR